MPKLNVWQVVGGTVVVTAVALLFWFLFRFHFLLLMIFAAIIISTAMQPIVQWLNQRGLPRATGIILVYGLLLLGIGLFFWLGAPFLIDQTAVMNNTASEAYQSLREQVIGSGNLIARRLAQSLPPNLSLMMEPPADDEAALASLSQLGEIVTMGFRTVLGIVATFLLAFYWTLEAEHIKSAAFLLVPQTRREAARQFVANAEEKLSGYVYGQGILVVAVGLLALIAYLLIGLPNALILAIFAGMMEAVPLLGPALGAVPAALVAFSLSPLHVLWVFVATAVIQQLENSLLVPRVMNQAIGVRPLVTLLAMYAFGSLFGVVGVLVSIPLAAIIQLLLDRFLWQRTAVAGEAGRDKQSVLRYQVQDLVQDIREQVRRKPHMATAATDQIEDSLEAIALDLDSFVAQKRRKS
ncbi:MAG: AI-2E family transporter [Ardenticatenaceae bacterium]|nr:AI-2E family transporter [Ardenticatenaceae bacterium]